MDGMRIPWYDHANKEGNMMEDHPRVRKKRPDVKVHYIRRGYNMLIVPNKKGEQKENATIHVDKN